MLGTSSRPILYLPPSFLSLTQHIYVSFAFSETFYAYITNIYIDSLFNFVHFVYTDSRLPYLLFYTLSFSFIMYLGDHFISDYKATSLSSMAPWCCTVRLHWSLFAQAPVIYTEVVSNPLLSQTMLQ